MNRSLRPPAPSTAHSSRCLTPPLSYPQRQHFPRFAAVAAWRIRRHNVHRPHRALSTLLPLPQRQHFPRFAAVAAWRIRSRNVHRPHSALSTLLPLPQRHRFPRFAAVAAWRIRSRNVHRPHSALSTLLPLPQRQHFPRFAAVAVRPLVTTCKLFTTNGKYCSGHSLQNIDNQLYHNTTRVFRPHQNIRKTLVVFLTISKSRTYQNTPLLHLPLDPPPPASTTFRRWGTSVPATTAANCGKRYNDIIATDRARYYSTSIPATARR